jgi:hypothetical protein
MAASDDRTGDVVVAAADATVRAVGRTWRWRHRGGGGTTKDPMPENPGTVLHHDSNRYATAIRISHAYEKIGADAIARYRRLRGDDVHFLTGLDEHGQKVAQAAADRAESPQAFVDDIASRFKTMWERLSISYDQFIRTTEPAHKAGVRALIERIHERTPDDFYEKGYEGWYCVGCELFKRDDEIDNGKCVLHPTRTLEWTTGATGFPSDEV